VTSANSLTLNEERALNTKHQIQDMPILQNLDNVEKSINVIHSRHMLWLRHTISANYFRLDDRVKHDCLLICLRCEFGNSVCERIPYQPEIHSLLRTRRFCFRLQIEVILVSRASYQRDMIY